MGETSQNLLKRKKEEPLSVHPDLHVIVLTLDSMLSAMFGYADL
jgi:hypothetical protein